MMPKDKELMGSAAATMPAFNKKSERFMGSPTIVLDFVLVLLRVAQITNLRTSSTSKKRAKNTLPIKLKKKATRIMARIVKRILK